MRRTEDQQEQLKPFSAKVEALAGYGIAAPEIALVLGAQEPELRRDYADELVCGGIKANARVAENLFRRATGEGREAVTAAIFWMKTRARWKETSVHEVSGPDGGAIEMTACSDFELAKRILLMLDRSGMQGNTLADVASDLNSTDDRDDG
jgi:hypothetical protein